MGDAKYKRKHREQGLCVDCSRQAYAPHVRCLEHLHQRNKGQMLYYSKNQDKWIRHGRKVRQERIDSGKCHRCGNVLDPDIDGLRVSCQNCRERICYDK